MSTDFRLVADAPGWVLVMDGVAQSWLDPDDPTHLEFGYMLRMADYLDAARPRGERMRVIHVGGAAMTMARYVAARRPTSPQIVLEPNQALTEMVRCELPLPAKSGIKVRAVDGRSGIAAMPNHYAQVVIVDAFADAQVPAENLVGPLGGGWKVANGSLGHERTMMWMAFANRLEQLLEDYHPVGEVNRDRYATMAMDYQALRLLGSVALGQAARGELQADGDDAAPLTGQLGLVGHPAGGGRGEGRLAGREAPGAPALDHRAGRMAAVRLRRWAGDRRGQDGAVRGLAGLVPLPDRHRPA
mgnify:CR=1 FL=1